MAGLRYLSQEDEVLANDFYWVDEFRNEILPMSIYKSMNFRGLAQFDVEDDWKRVPKAYTAVQQIPPDSTPNDSTHHTFRETLSSTKYPWKHPSDSALNDIKKWVDTNGERIHLNDHVFRQLMSMEDHDDWKRVRAGESAMQSLGVDNTPAGQSVHQHDHRGLESVEDASDDWKRVRAGESAMQSLGVDNTPAGQSVHQHDHRGLESVEDASDDWKRVRAGESAMQSLGVDTTVAGQRAQHHDFRGLEAVDASDDWKRVRGGESAMQSLGVDTVPFGNANCPDLRESPTLYTPFRFSRSSTASRVCPDLTRSDYPVSSHSFRPLPLGSSPSKRWRHSVSSLPSCAPDTEPLGLSSSLHEFRDDYRRLTAGTVSHDDASWLDALPLLRDTPFVFRASSRGLRAGKRARSPTALMDPSPFGNPSLHTFRDEEPSAVWHPSANASDGIRPLSVDTTLTPEEVVFRELERIGFKDDWNKSVQVTKPATPILLEPMPQHPSLVAYREQSDTALSPGSSSLSAFRVGRVGSAPPLVDTKPLQRHASAHAFRAELPVGQNKWRPAPRGRLLSSDSFDLTPMPEHRDITREDDRNKVWRPSLHGRDFFWDYAGASFGKMLRSSRKRTVRRHPSAKEFAPMTSEPLGEVLQQFSFRDEPSPAVLKGKRWNTSTRVSQTQFDTSIMSKPSASASPRPSRRSSVNSPWRKRSRPQSQQQERRRPRSEQQQRRPWRHSARSDDLLAGSCEPLDREPSEVQPDQLFFEQLRRHSYAPTSTPTPKRQRRSRPWSQGGRRAGGSSPSAGSLCLSPRNMFDTDPIPEVPELEASASEEQLDADLISPPTPQAEATAQQDGNAHHVDHTSPRQAQEAAAAGASKLPPMQVDGTWQAEAEESLQRVLEQRREARAQRRQELRQRKERRRQRHQPEQQQRQKTEGDDRPGAGDLGDGGTGDGGATMERSAAHRIIERKPKLTANALERLAKLRDLMEQQQF